MTRRNRRFARTAQALLLVASVVLSSFCVVGSEPVGPARAAEPPAVASIDPHPARHLRSIHPRWMDWGRTPRTSGTPAVIVPSPTAQPTSTPTWTPTPTPTSGPTASPAASPSPTTSTRSTAPTSLVPPASVPPAAPPPAVEAPAQPAAPASVAGRPGPSTTGVPAGTALTPSDEVRVTTPGAVLDGLDISGVVTIDAPGVVIKNSRIHGTEANGIDVRSGDVTVYDSEIYGFENAIAFGDWKAYRVNIHGTYGDGVKLGDNVTLQDSWIHDLTPADGAHADGGQMQDGVRNLVVKHNVIDVSSARTANSALFISPDFGPSTDGPVTITDNWLDGGNYSLYCVDGGNGRYVVKNIAITNNRFGRAAKYGAARVNVSVTQSGNVWADTGLQLSL